MALDTSIYGDYIKTGLDAASKLVNSNTQKAYTPYTSSAANAPSQTQMYDYTQSSPLQQINAPNYTLSAGNAPTYQGGNYDATPQTSQWNNYNATAYNQAAPAAATVNPNSAWSNYNFVDPSTGAPTFGKANTAAAFNAVNTDSAWSNYNFEGLSQAAPTYQGLMNGDYTALQTALTQPGQQAAQNAYNTGTQNLVNTMGGRGLYGSSVMQQQQTQGLDREFQNAAATNAANAAAQRYGMQQTDLQKSADMKFAGYQALMDQNIAGQQIGSQQSLAKNAQGLAATQMALQQSLAANEANQSNADRGLQQSLAANTFNQNNYQTTVQAGLAGQQIGAQQSLAENAANQQNLDRNLQQTTNINAINQQNYLAKMDEAQKLQSLNMGQSLAQNAQGMQQAQLNQQGLLANAANRLTADTNKNDFGLNLYAQKLAEQKDLNAYNAQETSGLRDQALNTANVDFTQADSMNQYNNLKYNAQKEYDTNLNNWQNQQNYERNFVYPQAASAYGDAQREQMMNQALALAGQGAPLATAASNAELQSAQLAAQQAAAQQNYNAQLWGSAAGALGSLGSGLLSSAANQPTSTTWNNLWS